MSDLALSFQSELTGLDAAAWIDAVEDLAEDHGYFEPLGPQFSATFLDAGPKLLVTFENAETIRATMPDAEPRGFAFTRREGWSHLAILSEGDSWFRDPWVYRYFDRLVDDGFFEDFDKVLFHGAGPCGYAAAAYSVVAPGARVLAVRPQATLNPRVAGWDNRFTAHRRQDFTQRYGYAPDMIDAVERAYIVFNPAQRLDAMHAALFTRPNSTLLRATGLGLRLEASLDALRVHDDLLRAAMDGDLTPAQFGRIMQTRKSSSAYLRGLLKRAQDHDHHVMAANICATVLRDKHDPFFADALDKLAAQGVTPTRPMTESAAE